MPLKKKDATEASPAHTAALSEQPHRGSHARSSACTSARPNACTSDREAAPQMPVGQAAPRIRPHIPTTIGLINADAAGHQAPSQILIHDFAAALLAYNAASAAGIEGLDTAPALPYFHIPAATLPATYGTSHTTQDSSNASAGQDTLDTLATCDALVLAFDATSGHAPKGLMQLIENVCAIRMNGSTGAAQKSTLPTSSQALVGNEHHAIRHAMHRIRIYAIARVDGLDSRPAYQAFCEIKHAFEHMQEPTREAAGAIWCGGLAIAGGDLITPLRKSPRMGMLLRKRSGAMDRLVAAVRSGRTVEDAAHAFGSTSTHAKAAGEGIVYAPAPLPPWVYPLYKKYLQPQKEY
ncbi:hypothetical protein K6V98_02080 [Collinsella sp. AGMB00827]|uniref:Uncharacterized protein n=1 Tax=Collinsella ureilytica TaxID=2869515 RepID=A0ABS7MJE9_9ACTN|nr:hypothetical protein [Collinsella urealyticum]MBY4797153.1 hypothetical protein [Collinsella urealyticum]